jgi:hypothetical protein
MRDPLDAVRRERSPQPTMRSSPPALDGIAHLARSSSSRSRLASQDGGHCVAVEAPVAANESNTSECEAFLISPRHRKRPGTSRQPINAIHVSEHEPDPASS